MTNDTSRPSRLDWLADHVANRAWQGAVLSVFMYVIALFDRNGDGVALIFWLALYIVVAPFIVRRVATRSPEGDHWRAAAVLAYGAFPFSVLIPWWRELNAWPAAVATFPVLFAWSLAAQIIALRDKGPVRPPRLRALVLAGAAAIWGTATLPLLAGAGLGLLLAVWEPPPGAVLYGPLVALLCLPLGLATGYASLKLFAAAAHAYAGETRSQDAS